MLIVGCDYHPGFQQIAFVKRGLVESLQAYLFNPATGTFASTGSLAAVLSMFVLWTPIMVSGDLRCRDGSRDPWRA